MTPQDHLALIGAKTAPHAILDRVHATREATDQSTYLAAAHATFAALDELDQALSTQRYLNGGSEPGDEDWALYVVLLRFELVYYHLYKLNRTRIRDLANLGPYLRDLHQQGPEVDLMAIRRDAVLADTYRNPKGTVALGLPDLWGAHDRWRFDAAALRDAGTQESQKPAGKGAFVRGISAHRRRIGVEFPVEEGRYHLIIANNCPWCHRVSLTRSIKGLTDAISLDVLWYRRDADRGWQFRPDLDGFDVDSLFGAQYVTDIYKRAGSSETSVPLLWDKTTNDVVSNESAEIVRMLDEAWPDRGPQLAPPALIPQIDAANAWIWRDINNGAYKAGFSSNQQTYERAYHRFFAALERLDRLFAKQQWVCGDTLTEADVRLFPTIFRFDPVYYVRMKLNHRMVREYPHLSRWQSDFWQVPGVREASNLEHCRLGYFGRTSDGRIPMGPDPLFEPG